MNPTRRAFLGGGLAVAAWGPGPSRAGTLARGSDGFLLFEAASSRLRLAPPRPSRQRPCPTPGRRQGRSSGSRRGRS